MDYDSGSNWRQQCRREREPGNENDKWATNNRHTDKTLFKHGKKKHQLLINKTGTRQCTRAVWRTLEYVAVYFCTSAWLCNSFHSSFEYTLRSTWRLNGPTQAQNAQNNLVWVYQSWRMHWHTC